MKTQKINLADDLEIIRNSVDEDDIRKLRVKVTIVLAALQAVDLALTFMVMSKGLPENNIVAQFVMGLGLIVPVKLGLGIIAVWRASKKGSQKEYPELPALVLASFGVGIYTLTVILNLLSLSML